MKKYVYSAEGLSSKQRAKIAKNSTDPKELRRLAYDNADLVKLAVFNNDYTPDAVRKALEASLSGSKNASVRQGVAENRNTSADILAQLADDENWGVRREVAWNPNTPADILAQLADDADEEVRSAVAKNLNTPVDALVQLAGDAYTYSRRGVAGNPNTPEDILAQFAVDGERDFRRIVAGNPNTPADILAQLADDEDSWVRARVAKHPNTTVDILAQLADDEDEEVREWVAKNPNTPADIFVQLASDKDEDVRRFASKNSKSKKRKPPKSDWSIPLYSITDYSQIESEIDQVIDQAANGYAKKFLGGTANVSIPDGVYDTGGAITITFKTPDETFTETVDAEDILGPATSQNMKKKCVDRTIQWLESNL